MHCSTCPSDRQDLCRREGCYAKLFELRHETIVVVDEVDPAPRPVSGTPDPVLGPIRGSFHDLRTQIRFRPAAAVLDDLGLQVKRLDVEHGDILVVRTAKALTRAEADAVVAMVSGLARRHGVRDVSVMVLDTCTDLTVERPGAVDTRMQHQAPRTAPIVTR